ncbi:MAG: acyltransferase [Candidatus Accumulibacter sp.]|uniref:acyltransferase family protein n=1 Tax=Accumulibacter sp. TaxID=2053492 RepID=UPI002584D036|nr:acyltransferase [Accumulibacter sp.]MCM8620684.1 acyltransferase [Accumulibacter sp.]
MTAGDELGCLSQGQAMNRTFSVYLDLVRFGAAFLVYLYHSNQRFLSKNILPASNFGHSSVIVFFVLSGFVIAFVTATKESNLPSYAASRISRVLSVTVPAIALTVLLDAIGRSLYPEIYRYPFDQFAARIFGSLFFLNEIWFVSITSFSNVPYWSICYEWWYYVLFGMLTFLQRKWRWWAVVVTMFLLGPKIVLLAPLWGLGVLLYHWQAPRNKLSLPVSWVMALISTVGIVAFHWYDIGGLGTEWLKSHLGEELHKELTFSKFFVGDYLLAALVFTNFAAVRNIAAAHDSALNAIAAPVKYVANNTFTLYLLHQPLFLFWAAVVRGDPVGHTYWIVVTVLTLSSVVAIGYFTENKRFLLRDWLLVRFSHSARLHAGETGRHG